MTSISEKYGEAMHCPMWGFAMERMIPAHMHDVLYNYLVHRIAPGGFLWAVLSNDLAGAVLRADDVNIGFLPEYVRFLRNSAPRDAHGSYERVRDWIEQPDKTKTPLPLGRAAL